MLNATYCIINYTIDSLYQLLTALVHCLPPSGQNWPLSLGIGNGLYHCIPSSVVWIRYKLTVSRSYSNVTALQCLVCGERKWEHVDCVPFCNGSQDKERGKQEDLTLLSWQSKVCPLWVWSCAQPCQGNKVASPYFSENKCGYWFWQDSRNPNGFLCLLCINRRYWPPQLSSYQYFSLTLKFIF